MHIWFEIALAVLNQAFYYFQLSEATAFYQAVLVQIEICRNWYEFANTSGIWTCPELCHELLCLGLHCCEEPLAILVGVPACRLSHDLQNIFK